MTGLQSMTGFASAQTVADAQKITCEIRSVNGKNLDIRLRLTPGHEALEVPLKKLIGAHVSRGNVQASVSIGKVDGKPQIAIDETAFRSIAEKASELASEYGIDAPTADGILAVRGVVLGDDAQASVPGDDEATNAAITKTVEIAAAKLAEMRSQEGASLKAILSGQLDEIERNVTAARDDPANQPGAIQQRLTAQIEQLLDGQADGALDPDRLNAEAALLATKADIREEIDRMDAHVAAARKLLSEGGAVGRKLDFLSQEFNRETNTICSKSASATLTAIGLDLKAVIDQFREQVQNLQ